MTQTVRLLGHFMNSSEERLDLVCDFATASIPPSRREIGAGGDSQLFMYPTAIVLHGVTAECLVAVRKDRWTHVEWLIVDETTPRELALSSLNIEGNDIRIIV